MSGLGSPGPVGGSFVQGGGRGIIDGTAFAERFGGKVVDHLDAFGEEHKARIRRYREFWKLYKGFHWDFARGQGDPNNEPLVTMNYAKRLIDVHVNFLMKNGFDITIPDLPETEENERDKHQMAKTKLDEIWRQNQKALTAFEIGQMGAITGDCFLRVFWRANPPLEDPHAAIEVLPSHFCFPEYGGETGFDRKTMSRITIAMPRYEDDPNSNVFSFFRLRRGNPKKQKRIVMYAEVWTAQTKQMWREDQLVEEKDNAFGEIPIVHIRNYPVAGEAFGMSDLHLVHSLQREINEKATDISDVVNYHGSPVTILKGAKISQLDRGANRVWSIPADADAKNLELTGDLAASHKFLEMLMAVMFDLAGVPRSALGADQNITGTSGVALAMKFLPLMEIRAVKEETYGLGLRLLNRILLMVTEVMDREWGQEFEQLGKRRFITDIAWPPPLPKDVMNQLNEARERLDLGLSTRKRELMKMGHGEQDADTIIKEVDEEREKMAQQDFNVGGMLDTGDTQDNRSGNPNPVRPSPITQGEAVSRNAEQDLDEPL